MQTKTSHIFCYRVLRGMNYITFEYELDPEKDKINKVVVKKDGSEVDSKVCPSSKVNVEKRRVDGIKNGCYDISVIVEQQDQNSTYIHNYSKTMQINDFEGIYCFFISTLHSLKLLFRYCIHVFS